MILSLKGPENHLICIVVSTLTKAAGRNRDFIFLAFFLHKAKVNYESLLFPQWNFDIFPSADYVSI